MAGENGPRFAGLAMAEAAGCLVVWRHVPHRFGLSVILFGAGIGLWAFAFVSFVGGWSDFGYRNLDPVQSFLHWPLVGVGLAFSASLGTILLVTAPYVAFVRRTWIIEPGCIASLTRIPPLRLVRERTYARVQRIEVWHGIWEEGDGHEVSLRFWADESFSTRSTRAGSGHMVSSRRFQSLGPISMGVLVGLEEHTNRSPCPAELLKLGQFIATRVGVPFQHVQEFIARPYRGGED